MGWGFHWVPLGRSWYLYTLGISWGKCGCIQYAFMSSKLSQVGDPMEPTLWRHGHQWSPYPNASKSGRVLLTRCVCSFASCSVPSTPSRSSGGPGARCARFAKDRGSRVREESDGGGRVKRKASQRACFMDLCFPRATFCRSGHRSFHVDAKP